MRGAATVAAHPVGRPPQQGDRSAPVAALQMGDPDGQLGQPAPQLALLGRGLFPGRFQYLMGLERPPRLEQPLGLGQGRAGRERRLGYWFDAGEPAGQWPSEFVSRTGVAGPPAAIAVTWHDLSMDHGRFLAHLFGLGYGGRMTTPLQPSMLDVAEAAGVGPLSPRRHPLSRGAWVDYLPGWVRGSDEVFATLQEQVQWRAERREMYDREVAVPRLLRWYDGDEPLPHDVLTRARERLTAHYAAELGEPFVTAGMCLYRDGRDSVAWHGDTNGRSASHDTMVAIVSFGSPRALLLRPRGGGRSLRFAVGHGDLLVMGGSCQRTWEHSVPKTARPVGPRVSVQFRPAGVS